MAIIQTVVVGGGVQPSSTAFGATAEQALGTVSNGAYVPPASPFTANFTGVVTIPNNGLRYKFYYNDAISGNLTFPDLTTVGENVFYNCFLGCTNLNGAISFPSLTTAQKGAFYAAFTDTNVTSFSAPNLTAISNNGFTNALKGTKVTSIDLSSVICSTVILKPSFLLVLCFIL